MSAGGRGIVAVIGDGNCGTELAAVAEAVGAGLARAGFAIVCGGLGGVMAAACRGAKSAGGTTIGILPGSDAAAANEWVDFPIVTGLGEARNILVVKTGRAVVALGGAYGTLSEIAFALRDQKPLVSLGSWQLNRPDGSSVPVHRAQSADEAVQWLATVLAEQRDA